MKTNKIWIWDDTKNVWKQFDRDNPRIDWDHPHTPPGKVKIAVSSKPAAKWAYHYWGVTQQEAADRANAFRKTEIERLQAQIRDIESQMVKPEETG